LSGLSEEGGEETRRAKDKGALSETKKKKISTGKESLLRESHVTTSEGEGGGRPGEGRWETLERV